MTGELYEVRVLGLVPDDVAGQLDEVLVTVTGVSTVLSGNVADQSALLGLLARIRGMGLEVVEVRKLYAPDVEGVGQSD